MLYAENADPFDELSLYYEFREELVGRINRGRWAMLIFAGLLVAGMLFPVTLSSSAALTIGSIGALLSVLGFAVALSARRAKVNGRSLGDTLGQTLKCDSYIRERMQQGIPVPDHRRKSTEAFLNSKLEQMPRFFVTMLRDDDFLPVRFPIAEKQAGFARVMIASTRFHAVKADILGAVWLLLIFIMGWTSVFMIVWGLNPARCLLGSVVCSGAFQGLSTRPTSGDFLYFMLNAAFANMPPDIAVRSRLAHAAFTGTFISGALLLARYVIVAISEARNQIGTQLPDDASPFK